MHDKVTEERDQMTMAHCEIVRERDDCENKATLCVAIGPLGKGSLRIACQRCVDELRADGVEVRVTGLSVQVTHVRN